MAKIISPYLQSLAKTTPEKVRQTETDYRQKDVAGSLSAPDTYRAGQQFASTLMTDTLLSHENGEVLSMFENETFAKIISDYWKIDKNIVKADLPRFIEKYTGIKVGANWLQELGEYASTWEDNKRLSYYQFMMNNMNPESDTYKKYEEISNNIVMEMSKKQKTFKSYGLIGNSIIEAAPNTLQFLEQMGIIVASTGLGAIAGGAMGAGALVNNGMLVSGGAGATLAGSSGAASAAGALTGAKVGHQLSLFRMDVIEAGGIAYEMRQMYNEDGTPMFTNEQIKIASIIYAAGIHLIEGYTDKFVDPIVKGMGLGKLSEPLKRFFEQNFITRLVGYGWDTLGQSAQEGIEGLWSSVVTDTAKDLVDILNRNNANTDAERVKQEFKNAADSAWEDFSQSLVGFGVGGIPTAILSGMTGLNRIYFNPTQVNAQMKTDANTYFDGGRPVDIRGIDTMGDSWSLESEEAIKDHKHHAIPVSYNQQTGLLVPITASDRALVATLRESGATGVSVIFVDAKANESLAQYHGAIINDENDYVYGTSGSTILVRDEEGLEYVNNYFKDNPNTTAITQGKDGSTTYFVRTDSGTEGVKVKIGTQEMEETPEKVEPVRSYRDWATLETERRGSDPYNIDNYLRSYEEEMAYQAIDEALPESDDMTFNQKRDLEFSKLGAARIMPIVSEITGINTSDLLKKFVFTFDTSGVLGDKAYGGFQQTGNQYKITINNTVRPDTIMHEVIHGLRRLASAEQLSGFAEAYGGTTGGMWASDIEKTDDGYVLGDKTYKTYVEAFKAASAYEERFVDDFMRYLYGETGFNDAQKSFFAKVKQFFEVFWDRMRSILADKLDAKTVKAFDILFGKDTDAQERTDFVEVAATEGIQRATELASTGLEDEDMLERDEDSGLDEEGNILWQIREKEPPKETGIGYKVFYEKDGNLYPPMVANPNGEPTPVGVWLDADAAPVVETSKTGRPKVKAGGKGTQGGSGTLAYRPGWHLGEIPYAIQFNRLNPETGEKDLFPANFVWAEVEYAKDKNYQQEAESYGYNEAGNYQHSLAGLPYLPTDGYYTYRTNPNPETDPWIITGAMKINKVLSNEEVDALVKEAGREPQKRQMLYQKMAPNGKPSNLTDEQWKMVRTPEFKAWFGDWENDPENASKVVDENGEPKVVSHSTNKVFDTFALAQQNDAGWLGKGFYFFGDRTLDGLYGRNVMEVFLNIRKPYMLSDKEHELLSIKDNVVTSENFSNKLITEGFDGVYYNGDLNQEWLAFEPNQIKSATNNNGQFSRTNNSILYQRIMDRNTQARIDADYEETYNKYFNTEDWMKAPNGNPTNLTERQWVQTRTPAFMDWFGDWLNDPENASKIVDENGEPKVVFHGATANFDTFAKRSDIGFHFGTKLQAEEVLYAHSNEMGFNEEEAQMLETFLNIRNPITGITDPGSWTGDNLTMAQELLSKGYISDVAYKGLERMFMLDDLYNRVGDPARMNDVLRKELISKGYDGIIYTNLFEGTRWENGVEVHDESYMVFNPNQIKSATDNVGTFDSEADSILYQIEESNRIIENIAQDKNDIVRIDGLSYIKNDKGYDYNPDTIRNLKDSVSEALHGIDQIEFDFGGTLDFANGEERATVQTGSDNGKTEPVSARGLRPSVAKYFHFNTGWSGAEPSIAINDQWDNLGYVSFIGTRIKSATDLAKLFSIYRNPKLEYFHIVFVKYEITEETIKEKIIGQVALSSGLPGRTVAIPYRETSWINNRMKELGADGYYIMHNHPSGNVNPSDEDIQLTGRFGKEVSGLRGHIILDHNKYWLLGNYSSHGDMFFLGRNEEVSTEGFHPIPSFRTGLAISSVDRLAGYFSENISKGNGDSMLVFTDNGGYPVNTEFVSGFPDETTLREMLMNRQARGVLLVSRDPDVAKKKRDEILKLGHSYAYEVLSVKETGGYYLPDYSLASKDSFKQIDWGEEISAMEDRAKIASVPKWDKSDSSGTLFQLSDEERSKAIQARKNEIEYAVNSGEYWVRTEYLEEFKGEDWADRELKVRHWMNDNLEDWQRIRNLAYNSDDYQDFKDQIIRDSDGEWTDEDEALYSRLYKIASFRTSSEKDSVFIARHVIGDKELIETAKLLRGFADIEFVSRPKKRSHGYYKVSGLFNTAKGVSSKVKAIKETSTSEEIQEARDLIIKNPRPYRMAFERAELGEQRAGIIRGMGNKRFDVSAVSQESNDLTANWDFETVDDRLEEELDSLERERTELDRKANIAKAKKTDWKKTADRLEKKLAQANADLQKLQGERFLKENAQRRLAETTEERDRLLAEVKSLKAELSANRSDSNEFKKQRDERRERVKELNRKLVEANREVKRLSRIIDAIKRRDDAMNAKAVRLELIDRIMSTVKITKGTFGASGAYDAKYEEAFAFIAGLFAKQDRNALYERRSELLDMIQNAKEQGLEERDYEAYQDELEQVRALIKASEMRAVPAILRPFTEALHLKAENRQSLWTAEELSDILTIAQNVAFAARQSKLERDTKNYQRRSSVVDGYFEETYGNQFSPIMNSFDRETLIEMSGSKKYRTGKLGEALYGFKIVNATIGRLTRLFDGQKEGVLYDFFTRQARKLNENEVREISRRHEAGERKFKELGLKNSDLNKVLYLNKEGKEGKYTVIAQNGDKLRLTRGEVIGVYVYMQNQDGAEKIQSLFGNGISPFDVRKLVEKLTPAERAWGDYMIEDMSSQWTRINDILYGVYNLNLGKVERYFPFVSQNKLSKELEESVMFVGPDGDAIRWVNKGMTKERVHHAKYPLELNVSKTWASQIRRQEHFIAFAQWSRDANYYLSNNGQIGNIITQKFDKTAQETIQDYVNSINSPKFYSDDMDKLFATMVGRGASAAIIGNLSVMLKQIPTMFSAVGNVGVREFFASAIAPNITIENFLKANMIMYEMESARDFINENSPIMRNRRFGMELVGETGGIGKGAIENISAKVGEKLMKITAGLTDGYVTRTLWLARYMTVFNELRAQSQKAGTEFDIDKAHEEAVFKAGQLISETQNTSVPMDMSKQMRKAKSNPYMKPFYLFSSVAMNVFNMIAYDIPYYTRNHQIGKVMSTVGFVAFNVLATLAIGGTFHRKKNEEDEEYAKRIVNQMIGQAFGIAIPGFGSTISNAISGNTYGSSADIALLEDISTTIRTAFNPSKNKEVWENFGDVMFALIYTGAEGAGLPANMMKKVYKSIMNGNVGYLMNSTWAEILEDK